MIRKKIVQASKSGVGKGFTRSGELDSWQFQTTPDHNSAGGPNFHAIPRGGSRIMKERGLIVRKYSGRTLIAIASSSCSR